MVAVFAVALVAVVVGVLVSNVMVLAVWWQCGNDGWHPDITGLTGQAGQVAWAVSERRVPSQRKAPPCSPCSCQEKCSVLLVAMPLFLVASFAPSSDALCY